MRVKMQFLTSLLSGSSATVIIACSGESMCVQGHVEAFLQMDCILHYAVVHASDRKRVCVRLNASGYHP